MSSGHSAEKNFLMDVVAASDDVAILRKNQHVAGGIT